MGKLNSFQGSIAYWTLSIVAHVMRILPLGAALWIGRRIGDVARMANAKNRLKAMTHLRVAFGGSKTPEELFVIMKNFYRCYGQSIVELGRLPAVAREGFEKTVDVDGREHVDAAVRKGRGVIFLSMHSGNWELANIVGSMCGYPYNMVANPLDHMNRVADFLNSLRRSAGCRIINPGLGGREIIKCLKNNEIVTLVADQGGGDGVLVPFFGRDTSMSTGAVRLALKYGTAIVLVDIHRINNGRHHLSVQPFDVMATGDEEKDLKENLVRMAAVYEGWIKAHPEEYLWFYKTWKYSKEREVVVLDEGRTGHLRQSEAVAGHLLRVLHERGFKPSIRTVPVVYRSSWHAALVAAIPNILMMLSRYELEGLRPFLTRESFERVFSAKVEYVVSTGAKAAPVNAWIAAANKARGVVVLKTGNVSLRKFFLAIMPRHDMSLVRRKNIVSVNVAPNLITPEYLEQNKIKLIARYPFLKTSAKKKIGVLLGGDTKGVVMTQEQIKLILQQLKNAAERWDMEILLTTSRRTPTEVEELVSFVFRNDPRVPVLVIAGKNNIPEAVGGILGVADILVVSGESISMVSEAASSGKCTIVFPLEGKDGSVRKNKYTRFVDEMSASGYVLKASSKTLADTIGTAVNNTSGVQLLNDRAVMENALRKIII